MAARKVAILGGGKIGESLLAGLITSGWREPRHLVITGRREERVAELQERYGVRGTLSNAEAVSGAAYFARLAEAMIEAGILLGLGRETSTQLVVQTMLGTAHLLRDEGIHPVELREAVTSPGGTTIQAIRELEQAGVRAAFLNAIQAAMERSRELAAGEEGEAAT